MRITVVLPQPEGPTKTTSSPSAIDIDSGHVLKTEFLIEDAMISARVTTTFKADARLQIHVPAEMTEEYKPSYGGRVTGRATYGRFRQFAVRTEEEIQKPEVPKDR